jgi:hypothetical protein
MYDKRTAERAANPPAPGAPGAQRPQISKGADRRPQDQPMVNLQVYNPQKPPMPSRPMDVVVPTPYNMPVMGINPGGYMSGSNQPMTIPIAYQPLKNYTIDFSGINNNYSRLNMVLQDQLPDRDQLDTMTTISERKRLLQFIRSVFIKITDGEITSLGETTNVMSLLSRLKFVDLNPYHYDITTHNPLSTLPSNYLIYRTAYPLRYDPSNIAVRAAQDSTGINVRLYRLSIDALRARHLPGTRDNYNVWNELDWYEDVRQNVINAGRSPHLAMLYCWMVAPSTIDWDALNNAKKSHAVLSPGQLDRVVTKALQPQNLQPISNLGLVVDTAGRVGAAQIINSNNQSIVTSGAATSSAIILPINNSYTGIPATAEVPRLGNAAEYLAVGDGMINNVNGKRVPGRLLNGVWTPGQYINNVWEEGQEINGIWTPGKFVNGIWTPKNALNQMRKQLTVTQNAAMQAQFDTNNILRSVTNKLGQNVLLPADLNIPPTQTVHNNQVANVQSMPGDSGYCAVLLTDAYTHNMARWASIQYEREFNRATMSNTGSHSDNVWFNVLFQLMHAMHTMQCRGYAIDSMTVARNCFIKDLKIDPAAASGYWLYKINNIDYYLPNLGYLVLVDSAFYNQNPEFDGNPARTRGIHMADPATPSAELSKIRNINIVNMQTIMSNTFTKDFTHRNGVMPGEPVMKWMKNVVDKSLDNATVKPKLLESFEPLFFEHARRFMHNRIGKHLRINERSYLRENESRNFQRGQMVAYEYQYDTWVWVLFVENKANVRGRAIVLTRNSPTDPEINEKEVSLEALVPYMIGETIQQDFNSDEQRLTEGQLLETYISE